MIENKKYQFEHVGYIDMPDHFTRAACRQLARNLKQNAPLNFRALEGKRLYFQAETQHDLDRMVSQFEAMFSKNKMQYEKVNE